jgi:hypothetical protein
LRLFEDNVLGAGLRLIVVQQLGRELGGIEVESSLGTGLSFRVYLLVLRKPHEHEARHPIRVAHVLFVSTSTNRR